MIKSFTVENHRGESIKMELTRPEASGFVVVDVSGLGPVKSDVYISEFGSTDGGYFQSARIPTRNIVMDLAFMGTDIEKIRMDCYRYFPAKQPVTLTVETTKKTVEITGYVESNEPNIFSSKEATQISLLCPDPYFRLVDVEPTSVELSGTRAMFEFPFSNESLTEGLLQFGEISTYTEANIEYSGDGVNGLMIEADLYGRVVNPRFYIRNHGQELGINTSYVEEIVGSQLQSGDRISIDTRRGRKSVYLYRGDDIYNIVGALMPGSTWLTVERGDNVVTYQADENYSNMAVKFETVPLFLGV